MGDIFTVTFSQMCVLFIFIIIGFLLIKLKVINSSAIKTISKMITTIFLPFVLVKSFMTTFSNEQLDYLGPVLLFSVIITVITTVAGILIGKLLIKSDDYLKQMYQYGFLYANFTYMGIPIIETISPDNINYLTFYLIFTILPQLVFTLWALPTLLIPKENQKSSGNIIVDYLKKLCNPIFIGLAVGLFLGLTGLGTWISEHLTFITTTISTGAACMSPLAMLLTGIVIANYDFKKCLKDYRIYTASIIRVVFIPCILGFLLLIFKKTLGEELFRLLMACLLTYTAMPFGLNTIIVPSSFDKDVIDCATMALITSVLSLVTIPLIFAYFLSF